MAREHGTRQCYVFGPEPGSDRTKGCRCEACREANRAYARMSTKRLRRERAGKRRPRFVDPAEARAHLAWLSARHVGIRTVAEHTGLARSALSKIANGTTGRIERATAEKILAVGLHRARGGAHTDAAATWRLIDDLLAHGWTRTELARRLGSTAKEPALQIKRDRVTVETARKVAALHAELMPHVIARREQLREARALYRARERGEAA